MSDCLEGICQYLKILFFRPFRSDLKLHMGHYILFSETYYKVQFFLSKSQELPVFLGFIYHKYENDL